MIEVNRGDKDRKEKIIKRQIQAKKESIMRFDTSIKFHQEEIKIKNGCVDILNKEIYDLKIELKSLSNTKSVGE